MNETAISQATQILKQGGIVIFPTDTAFGIGCRIDDHRAVDRLFTIRKRPRTQATPVLVSSPEMALKYLSSPLLVVRRLMDEYWPGALTIVAQCKKELIYEPVRGGGDTIGLRMPNHSEVLTVIAAVNLPILGPSANFHGESTPYSQKELSPELIKLVDYVLPGECSLKQASTVIDTTTSPPAILRQGAVKFTKNQMIFEQAILYINTADREKTTIALKVGKKRLEKHSHREKHTSQTVLPLIKDILREQNIDLDKLSAIEVNTGPGSFTGLRLGITIANMLGFLLDIPINGEKKPVQPVYL